MPRLVRSVVAAAVLALVPAGHAAASNDGAHQITALATRAAALLTEEQRLVALSAPGTDLPSAQLDSVLQRLAQVDAEAYEALGELELLGVDLSDATRTVLERLPALSGTPTTPSSLVYDAAIADLERIGQTPSAVADIDDGNELGLLTVAALALVVLGGAALMHGLRRPVGSDIAETTWSDALTGVGNRRKLDRDLTVHAADGSVPTAVIMLVVDQFEALTYAFGNVVVDGVLRDVGKVLSANVRRGDVVYRYGAEEFCVLLPHATRVDAIGVAERVIAEARAITLADGTGITVSIGVADGDACNVGTVLHDADRALCGAKSTGCDGLATLAALETV